MSNFAPLVEGVTKIRDICTIPADSNIYTWRPLCLPYLPGRVDLPGRALAAAMAIFASPPLPPVV